VSKLRSGFTLVEMVVALAMMSLVGLAMFASLRFAQRSYDRIDLAERAVAELATAHRLLRTSIESAYPFNTESTSAGVPHGLVGDRTSFSVTAPMTQGAGFAGYGRYVFTLQPAEGNLFNVAVRRWIDRNGASPPETTDPETLIASVAGWDLQYLALSSVGESSGIERSTWLDEWRERERLPAAVKIRITYPAGDSRRWPELTVTTRITDDANCDFDVVAQDCRH
jgi:general secretion pathway protein J